MSAKLRSALHTPYKAHRDTEVAKIQLAQQRSVLVYLETTRPIWTEYMTISKETLSFVLCAVISIFGCNNGNDAEDLLMIPAESSDAQGSSSGGNDADTIEVGAPGQFSDASVPSGDATTEPGTQPCVVNTQQFVPDLNISGSQARIEDILLSDDEIYLMLRVDDAVYVQKFERDGTPIQPALFVGNGADTPGEFAVFGGALVVTVGRNEQTAINFSERHSRIRQAFNPCNRPNIVGSLCTGTSINYPHR